MTFMFEADVSHEASYEQINQFAKQHGCEAVLVQENGPGGGNPVYKFTSASYDCLEELALQVYQDDLEFVTTIISEV